MQKKITAYWRHKCTRRTPLTCGPFMGAICNNSLFLRLHKSVDKYTSPLVEHLPRVADPCMQSRTTPHFKGSKSWSTSAPVQLLNTSHTWTIHAYNPEQLLVLRALPSWSTRLVQVPKLGQSMYAIRNNSLFLGSESVDETLPSSHA